MEIILSVLGFIGIGGIITAILAKRKELEFKRLENKEKRYKSCLLYMDVYFNENNIKYLSSRQLDIQSPKDVIEYLKAEYHEMLLYASKEVILSVKLFLNNPSYENFLSAALNMRKDLWAKKSDFKVNDIALNTEYAEKSV